MGPIGFCRRGRRAGGPRPELLPASGWPPAPGPGERTGGRVVAEAALGLLPAQHPELYERPARAPYAGPEPDGFWTQDEFVAYLRSYVEHWQLPVRTGVTVVSVERANGDEGFVVRTEAGGQAQEPLTSRSVVVAAGIQHTPKMPAAPGPRARGSCSSTQPSTTVRERCRRGRSSWSEVASRACRLPRTSCRPAGPCT